MQTEITKELLKSFLEFQKNCPAIEKDGASVDKNGVEKYKYASLPQIMLRVTPILNKFDLMLNQIINSDLETMTLTTILSHIDGGCFVSTIILKKSELKAQYMNDLQGIGNSISYYRRYQATSMLNLVTDEDSDGNHSKFRNSDEIKADEEARAKAEAEKIEAEKIALEKHIQAGKEKNGPLTEEQIETACHQILAGDLEMFNKCQKYLITDEQISLLKVAKEQAESFTA